MENLVYQQIRQGENNVPLRKKILLTIWIVGTPESFRSVADRFGLSKSNAHVVFKEVICALKEMMPQFVKWPNAEECENNERVIHRIFLFYTMYQQCCKFCFVCSRFSVCDREDFRVLWGPLMDVTFPSNNRPEMQMIIIIVRDFIQLIFKVR